MDCLILNQASAGQKAADTVRLIRNDFGRTEPVKQLVWGYIVKQLSAYGGCLGSQRR